MKCLFFALPLFVSTVAFAQDGRGLAWTKDGKYFIYEQQAVIGEEEYPLRVIADARTGVTKSYDVREADDQGVYQKWVAEHPIAPSTASSKGPQGMEARIEGKRGKMKGEEYVAEGVADAAKAPPDTTVRCRVARGAVLVESAIMPLRFAGVNNRMEMFWSPDGRRVAWFNHETGTGSATHVLVFGPARGPRIQILAPDDTRSVVLERVSDAIDAEDIVPTSTGTATAMRAKTVVYAGPKEKLIAQKIAAKIPGGASVETLDWKASYEIIIELGSTVPGVKGQ